MTEKRMSKNKTSENDQTSGGPPQRAVTVQVPVAPVNEEANMPRHVDVHLDRVQQIGLRATYNALHADPPAKLRSGRYVQSFTDAVRWMFEQIGEAITSGEAIGAGQQMPAAGKPGNGKASRREGSAKQGNR
jgi:hypothetical protein